MVHDIEPDRAWGDIGCLDSGSAVTFAALRYLLSAPKER